MSSDTAKRTQELTLQLDQIHLSVEKRLFSPPSSFINHILLLNNSIKEKENIDLLSYYELLKTFIPSEQNSSDSRRIYPLQETSSLKINCLLPQLINQARREMFSFRNPSEKINPVIRRLSANFVAMHVAIYQDLLQKKTLTDHQINYLSEKINTLKATVVEIEKLNILEFIAHIERSLSSNLYAQLRSPMFSFFGRGKTNKRLMQEMSNLFEDLHSKPFTAEALIGALYLIDERLIPLLHESLKNRLTHSIHQFLGYIQGDSSLKQYDKSECIHQFNEQAKTLGVTWPTVNPSLLSPSTATPQSSNQAPQMGEFIPAAP